MRLKYYARQEDRSWWKPFKTETIPVKHEDPLARQIEHFAAVIRGEAESLVSGRDGLQNLKVTEAIAEAARSGSTVQISTNN
jgi:predicted dehydrogenase